MDQDKHGKTVWERLATRTHVPLPNGVRKLDRRWGRKRKDAFASASGWRAQVQLCVSEADDPRD